MSSEADNNLGSLEEKRESLYRSSESSFGRAKLTPEHARDLPHAWQEEQISAARKKPVRPKHVRFAALFLGASVAFFLVALAIAGYVLYSGSNTVSTNKVDVTIQGPTTIAGGDTVPLSVAVTNRNPTALKNATIEIDFPTGTRSASDVNQSYPRYIENLGTIPSGDTVTRSVKAIVFGAAGQTITLPVSLSYGTANSNAVFQKKSSYALSISSTPLSVSVDTLAETVSGKPLTFTLSVRSNASVALSNVALHATFPFGFSVASSSVPMDSGNDLMVGPLDPGQTKQITITGSLVGQDKEQRVFHFTVGTATAPQDPTLAVTYMTQDVTVTIAAPFISTDLAFNGSTADTIILTPGTVQNVTLTYANTLATTVTNAAIKIALTGTAIDYGSVSVSNGFYDSSNHTIVFSRSTDAQLASLAPGATGSETFTFSTVPKNGPSPEAGFSISVSGTRVGQTNVPEQISASTKKTAKVLTTVAVAGVASHRSDGATLTGPIPPRANTSTTYAITLSAQNTSNAVAGGTVTATLPDYVSYVGNASGTGTFAYDAASRTVTWNVGDLTSSAAAKGTFQVTLTPSTSQRGNTVPLTSSISFAGYDRFAQTNVSASAPAITTAITGDPGYAPNDAVVQ